MASVEFRAPEDELRVVFTLEATPRHDGNGGCEQISPEPRTQQKLFPESSNIVDGCGDDEPLTDHKVSQRQKQIGFGTVTKGYQNMMRLLDSDPRLIKGGVLPLQPPSASLRVSKRAWDVLARKWRRALHLFDDVFIPGQDDQHTTLEDVVEEQRKKWVSPRFVNTCKSERQRVSAQAIYTARDGPHVPKKLPVEENMKPILRSLDCFQDISRIVPDTASSLTKGNTGVTPSDAGIKMFIAPSAEALLFNVISSSPSHGGPAATSGRDSTRSPSPDMAVTPSTIAQMRAVSPMQSHSKSSHLKMTTTRSLSPNAAEWRGVQRRQEAPQLTSTLSPLAMPFCPPTTTQASSSAPAGRPNNFSPELSHHHQQHPSPQYLPTPSMRLESSFGRVASPSTERMQDLPTFAPPPPLYTHHKPSKMTSLVSDEGSAPSS